MIMLGHLIYTYDRLDDARISQEISKSRYGKKLDGVHLVHAYNGKPSFGYTKYLEDKLLKIKNRGHFKGAADLINAGLSYFDTLGVKKVRYVLVTASDTWVLNVGFLVKIIKTMNRENKGLSTSSWGRAKHPEKPTGFATDFFVIDMAWNKKTKLFPVNFDKYKEKFSDQLATSYGVPILEGAVQYQYAKYYIEHFEDNDMWRKRNNDLLRIVEREPIHSAKGERRYSWPSIGLYTSHNSVDKKRALVKFKSDLGKYSQKLIQSKTTGYYNK
jgi:hypothetical protein